MSMQKVKIRHQRWRSQRSKPILPQFWHFRNVAPVWIHILLRNDAQCLKWPTRGALLFFKVISQISRSQGLENVWFGSDLRFSGWQLQFEFMDGYKMTHIGFWSMEEVSQGHLWNFKVRRAEQSIGISFVITRPVAAINSIRFTLFLQNYS